jgi:heat shock protein HspQ
VQVGSTPEILPAKEQRLKSKTLMLNARSEFYRSERQQVSREDYRPHVHDLGVMYASPTIRPECSILNCTGPWMSASASQQVTFDRKMLAVNAFSKLIRFGIVGAVLVCARYGFAQGVPCSEVKPDHYSPTPDRAKHPSISREANGAFDQSRKVTSQLGPNSWFVTVDPVYTNTPPWNTTIFVGRVGNDKPFLKIMVLDHGNPLNVKWVTDRLLHMNIWWGRFGMSDWIIDVDRGTVVYDELLNFYKEHGCVDDPKKTGP